MAIRCGRRTSRGIFTKLFLQGVSLRRHRFLRG